MKKNENKRDIKIDENLIRLTQIPRGLDWNKSKEPISPEMRRMIYRRDNWTCQICWRTSASGLSYIPIIHHIIPNGPATPENLILLCQRCHTIIHRVLYVTKRWKYCISHNF